jgi:hypothetical protein
MTTATPSGSSPISAPKPRGLNADLTIRQIRTGDEVRRLAVIRRPLGNSVVALAGLAVLVVAVVAQGRGGGQDGALGIGIALVVLIVGTVCIQRLGRVRVLIGFNPDGLWAPAAGWVEWGQVRHIEVRQTSNPITGRRHTLWVRYEPLPLADLEPPVEASDVWLDASPRLRQAKALALVDEMERCWVNANPLVNPRSTSP